jgi:hypothetical protein
MEGYSTRETRNRVGEGIGRTIGIKGYALINEIRWPLTQNAI